MFSLVSSSRPMLSQLARHFSVAAIRLEGRSKTLFVGSVNFDTTRANLQKAFEKYGHIKETRIVTDKFSGRSRGFGYVEFESEEQAAEALQESQRSEIVIDGRAVRLDYAVDKVPRPSRPEASPSSIVYLGNIPTDLSSEQIREILENDFGGEVQMDSVRALPPRSPDGPLSEFSLPSTMDKNRGFAFVEFADVESASSALEVIKNKVQSGWTIGNKAPVASFAEPPRPRTERREGYGGAPRDNRGYGRRDRDSSSGFGSRERRDDRGYGGGRQQRSQSFSDRYGRGDDY